MAVYAFWEFEFDARAVALELRERGTPFHLKINPEENFSAPEVQRRISSTTDPATLYLAFIDAIEYCGRDALMR